MTEEQMSMMKKLIKKHGIGATDGEWLLVYLYKMSRPNVQKILYKNVQLVCLLYVVF